MSTTQKPALVTLTLQSLQQHVAGRPRPTLCNVEVAERIAAQ